MDVLTFLAHPDDETMLCGGTLALLARLGVKVHVVCATRGEGGELGEPPVCTREELGQVREQELVCAVQALGAASLTVFDYVDPLVGPEDTLFPYTDDAVVLAGQVALSLKQFRPAAVLTHGSDGEYGHPAHKLSHQAARLAVTSLSEDAPALYTVQADFPGHPRERLANPSDPAHFVLDVSAAMEQKLAAALCHRSQNALFVRRQSKEQGRLLTVAEVLLRVESLHRALPPVPAGALPADPLAELLGSSGYIKK